MNIEFLTFNQIVLCMILSFVILIFLKVIIFFRRLSKEFEYPINIFNGMIRDFYVLYPKQVIMYKGRIFKRGMTIKVTTNQKKYEGQFVGFNGKNMICLITETAIVTNNIKNIKDIIVIEK